MSWITQKHVLGGSPLGVSALSDAALLLGACVMGQWNGRGFHQCTSIRDTIKLHKETKGSSSPSELTTQHHYAAHGAAEPCSLGCSGLSILRKLGQKYLKFLPMPLSLSFSLSTPSLHPPFSHFPLPLSISSPFLFTPFRLSHSPSLTLSLPPSLTFSVHPSSLSLSLPFSIPSLPPHLPVHTPPVQQTGTPSVKHHSFTPAETTADLS